MEKGEKGGFICKKSTPALLFQRREEAAPKDHLNFQIWDNVGYTSALMPRLEMLNPKN